IFYAREGFPVSDVIAAAWAESSEKLRSLPESASVYLPSGRAPRAAEIFRNPGLADSLQRIARDGAASFYDGAIAEAMLALSREMGGTLTAADLKEFEPEWVDPISTTYRGWTVYELP